MDDPIRVGREALERHAWTEAFDALQAADRIRPLQGEDLERLAEAAFFAPHPEVVLEAKERAFRAYEAAGDTERAAFLAINIGVIAWCFRITRRGLDAAR